MDFDETLATYLGTQDEELNVATEQETEQTQEEPMSSFDEALELYLAHTTIAEAKQKKSKGVDAMVKRARDKGWAGGGGNPWHGSDGKFSTRGAAKSASTDQGEGPKYRGKMGSAGSPKPGKKVAHDCGRNARRKGLDQRCQDKTP